MLTTRPGSVLGKLLPFRFLATDLNRLIASAMCPKNKVSMQQHLFPSPIRWGQWFPRHCYLRSANHTLPNFSLIPPPSNFRSSGHKVAIKCCQISFDWAFKTSWLFLAPKPQLRVWWRLSENLGIALVCPVLGEGQKGFGSILQALKCLDKAQQLQLDLSRYPA